MLCERRKNRSYLWYVFPGFPVIIREWVHEITEQNSVNIRWGSSIRRYVEFSKPIFRSENTKCRSNFKKVPLKSSRIVNSDTYVLVAVLLAGQLLAAVRPPGIAVDATRIRKTEATPTLGNFHIGQTSSGPMIKSWKSQARYQLSPMHMLERKKFSH